MAQLTANYSPGEAYFFGYSPRSSARGFGVGFAMAASFFEFEIACVIAKLKRYERSVKLDQNRLRRIKGENPGRRKCSKFFSKMLNYIRYILHP